MKKYNLISVLLNATKSEDQLDKNTLIYFSLSITGFLYIILLLMLHFNLEIVDLFSINFFYIFLLITLIVTIIKFRKITIAYNNKEENNKVIIYYALLEVPMLLALIYLLILAFDLMA